MKKISLLLLLCVLFLVNGFSQVNFKQLSEQQIKNLLCHKWQLTFLEAKGKKINVPASVPKLYLGLQSNGTLEEIQDKKKYTGNWSYKHDTFSLITEDKDGKENYDIVNLTNTILVIRSKFKGIPFNMGMQLVD